jgi:hypothetical protein
MRIFFHKYFLLSLSLFSVFLISMGSVSAQTKDSSGKPTTHGKASIIAPDDSRISFVGTKRMEITKWQRRLRDNGIPQERVSLENTTSLETGRTSISLETATTQYTENVTEIFNDDDWVRKLGKKRIRGFEILIDVKKSSNSSGRFRYLIAGTNSNKTDKCLFAAQLFTPVESSAAGERFRDGLNILYCRSNTSESELLEYYNSIRVGEN